MTPRLERRDASMAERDASWRLTACVLARARCYGVACIDSRRGSGEARFCDRQSPERTSELLRLAGAGGDHVERGSLWTVARKLEPAAWFDDGDGRHPCSAHVGMADLVSD